MHNIEEIDDFRVDLDPSYTKYIIPEIQYHLKEDSPNIWYDLMEDIDPSLAEEIVQFLKQKLKVKITNNSFKTELDLCKQYFPKFDWSAKSITEFEDNLFNRFTGVLGNIEIKIDLGKDWKDSVILVNGKWYIDEIDYTTPNDLESILIALNKAFNETYKSYTNVVESIKNVLGDFTE